jgi:hypothetical protein
MIMELGLRLGLGSKARGALPPWTPHERKRRSIRNRVWKGGRHRALPRAKASPLPNPYFCASRGASPRGGQGGRAPLPCLRTKPQAQTP